MMRPRDSITMVRMRTVRIDLRGDGKSIGTVSPRALENEYLCLIIGDVPRDQSIDFTDFVAAARDLLDRCCPMPAEFGL